MSSLMLDAEALYNDLRAAMPALLTAFAEPTQLVGVASGGAWLAQRLHKDLGLAGEAGVLSSSMHRDDFSQRGHGGSQIVVQRFGVKHQTAHGRPLKNCSRMMQADAASAAGAPLANASVVL